MTTIKRWLFVLPVAGLSLAGLVFLSAGCATSLPRLSETTTATTAGAASPVAVSASQPETPLSALPVGGERFDWSGAKAIHPSILRTAFAVEQPRLMKGSCVRIDLTDTNLRFRATGRAEGWGEPMPECPDKTYRIRTRRQTVRDFMLESRKPVSKGGRGLDMRVAVNCSPWGPWEAPWTHKYADQTGLIVSEGELVAPAIGYPSFIVYTDGSVGFRQVKSSDPITNIQTAVSGFGLCLTNGIIMAENNPASLAPRTGFGLSRDRRYLFFFVVDGRQPDYSMGANTYDVAAWMRYYGADDAMNMDGGGSTTLFCWDPEPDPDNTDPKSKSTPNLHKRNRQLNNAERSVACSLGIYVIGETGR